MAAGEIFWDVVPYVVLAIVVVGTWWRYRYDKFGWTTRSSQLGEDRPILGHIVFILGLVLIAIGHGWAINWAYVRLAGHHRHHQRRA